MLEGTRARIKFRAKKARRNPSAPPPSANRRLSVSIWRTNRSRVAPRAVRTAISFWRVAARETSSVAMFAQAIKSTKDTAAIKTSSKVRTEPTTSS